MTSMLTIAIISSDQVPLSHAFMQRTTLERINQVKNLGVPIVDTMIIGDPFVATYTLRLVTDNSLPENVLIVSPDVKAEFYANLSALEIRPLTTLR